MSPVNSNLDYLDYTISDIQSGVQNNNDIITGTLKSIDKYIWPFNFRENYMDDSSYHYIALDLSENNLDELISLTIKIDNGPTIDLLDYAGYLDKIHDSEYNNIIDSETVDTEVLIYTSWMRTFKNNKKLILEILPDNEEIVIAQHSVTESFKQYIDITNLVLE